MWKNLVAIFKVKVTARAYMTVSTISSKQLVSLESNLILIIQYHKQECPVKRLDSELLHSRSRSQ